MNSVTREKKTGGNFYIPFTSQSATLHPRMSSDPSIPLAEAWPKSLCFLPWEAGSGSFIKIARIRHYSFATDSYLYMKLTVRNHLEFIDFSSIFCLHFSQRHEIIWYHCQAISTQHDFTF